MHKTDIDTFIQTNCFSLVGLIKTINHHERSTPERHTHITKGLETTERERESSILRCDHTNNILKRNNENNKQSRWGTENELTSIERKQAVRVQQTFRSVPSQAWDGWCACVSRTKKKEKNLHHWNCRRGLPDSLWWLPVIRADGLV